MKKAWLSFFVVIAFLSLSAIPVMAADTSTEIEQLKGEVHQLLKRIEELEKKQGEVATKAVETEKKMVEVEKKAEKVEKKSLKDRIEFGGEARFRVAVENATADEDFYGDGQPSKEHKFRDETTFPLRVRLNAHVEVVPDWVDFYARLTMNKRWGAWEGSPTDPVSKLNDPFNRPNSFESSIGHDMNARFERAYMTMNLPWINGKWYIGRLPGMDGAPQRQENYLFPRLFIDSEIDGTLLKVDAPESALDSVNLPWTSRLWGKQSEPGKAPTLKQYEAKVRDKTGIILGYLKYDERKMKDISTEKETKADADVFLAQAQVKIGKDTEVIWDGLTMSDWHMPNTSAVSYVPDVRTDYYLTGVYVDTQLFGFQLYGAYYYSHFKVPEFSFTPTGGSKTNVTAQSFPGRIWFVGFNTGDLIHPKHQLSVEFADGSDTWINPFNYRGYRRKGTVSQPAGNYFFDSSGKSTVGFYPFNAQVWDVYYDYYAWKNVRFRLGYMDFLYSKHDIKAGDNFSVLGSSKFQHDYWPYAEVNLSF